MIRFCDKDVFCVEYDRIRRGDLLKYFLNGNLDEIVCVLDTDGRYLGCITYRKLIQCEKAEDAISRDWLVFDKDIWKNARLFFAVYKAESESCLLLPVIDENQQLLCFAYEDEEANRNLRMLRELQEKSNALQFADIYPNCQCVKIYEFNELAYFFAKYLAAQKIPVQTEGSMWRRFIESEEAEYLNYNYMTIYAEGVLEKDSNWLKNLLRSVSVEFECIDRIYEENIKAGIIKDADWNDREFLDYLRKADEVALLGTDATALDAYDYLKRMEIEISCFVSDTCDDRNRRIFGKQVLRTIEVMEKYSQAIFVNPYETGSAWGMGRTDEFDYMGYERNKSFFLLNDYVKIQGEGLKTALREVGQIVLAGDIWLCEKLADYLDRNGICGQDQLQYIILSDEMITKNTHLKIANTDNLKKNVLCLIAMPENYYTINFDRELQERRTKILSSLHSYGIENYTDYFSSMVTWMRIEAETKCKYQINFLQPKRVVIGSINSCSGNMFFRGLLDGHPSIMMIDYNYLNTNLFWFCMNFAGRTVSEIPSMFLQFYQSEWRGPELENLDLFLEKMSFLLGKKDRFTSQELFMIFHIAFMYMYGKDIVSIKEMILYWEPHHMPRDVAEDSVQWLGTETMTCDIINVVRNLCARNGSVLKGILKLNWTGRGDICHIAIKEDDIERKVYNNSKRYIVRFEDIKCRPEEELYKLCKEWDIPWSESLMCTTLHGKESVYQNGNKQIKNFDLSPVYNTYEEYLSEFDRFRITLIGMLWQKKYGYPYVDISMYSKRELQEIFLKEFKFESQLCFDTERTRILFQIRFQNYVRKRIQKIRMKTQK